MTKEFGIAVENISTGDLVVIEDGAVRRARQPDGPLTEIPLPSALRTKKFMLEAEEAKRCAEVVKKLLAWNEAISADAADRIAIEIRRLETLAESESR